VPDLDTSAFAFASDLADEGVEQVLANIQERAGLDGITPAFSYHALRDVFPHNPRRKVRLQPNGALYFPPELSLYERIKPRVDSEAAETEVLAETCRAAAARGMRVDAWTIFLHADRPDDNQDCVTVNAFGDRYPADLCPAHPDVRAYVRALVADVCRHDIGSIFGESLHYHPVEHGHEHERYLIELGTKARYLLGLCFCEHCLARAGEEGVDGDAVRAAVRDDLDNAFARRDAAVSGELERDMLADVAGGGLLAYLHARSATVTALAAEAAEVAAAAGKRFVFMDPSGAVKGYWTGKPEGEPAASIGWRLGIDLPALAAVCPEVQALAYAADVERVRLDLEAYRDALGDATVSAVFRPIPPDCETADNLAAKLALARDLGLTWAGIYHYGFLRLETLDLVRAAFQGA
jgi:hypothetical protein